MVRIGVGQVLRERWRIDALIGEGGLATVWAATHRNGDRVAIKALRPDFAKNEYIRERFVREAKIANRIRHPGIVRVIDDDTLPDGTAIIVMDLLVGETLEHRRLRMGGKLESDEVVEQLATVLAVLEVAHAAGVIHRDLKPDNLFLEVGGRLRVLDFGIARVLEGSEFVTQTGTVVGTLEYMSPEQAGGRSREVDARSDVYSAGATAFKLLSGQPVHRTKNAPELMMASMSRPARSLAEAAPELPSELVRIVDRALRQNPQDRWPSATEMRHALADFQPRNSPRILDLARNLAVGEQTTEGGGASLDDAATHRMADVRSFATRDGDGPTLVTHAANASLGAPAFAVGHVAAPIPPPAPRLDVRAPVARKSVAAYVVAGGLVLALVTAVAAILLMRAIL